MIKRLLFFPEFVEETINDPIIQELLERNGVYIEIEKIPLKSVKIDKIPRKTGTETLRHRILKKVGYELLRDIGERNPIYEHGGHDVWAPTLKIRIECGHTPFVRMIESLFLLQDIKEFWHLDYLDDEKLRLIKFIKTRDQDYLYLPDHIRLILHYRTRWVYAIRPIDPITYSKLKLSRV